MNKETVRRRIAEIGIIPAIRLSSFDDAVFAAGAVVDGGIPIAEVTMTTFGAFDVISEFARNRPEAIIGAGTITDIETARRCLGAGAKFLTSPGFDIQLVEFAVQHDVVVFPGAVTPCEIMAAWNAGADFVKIFPCSSFGGANYISALKKPFPDIPLIASGGVTQATAADFILAGSAALGIGQDLIPREAVERREADWIRELAGRFLRTVRDARSQRAA